MTFACIDPGEKAVTLVSVHRGTHVSIDGRIDKINAFYQLGGADKAREVMSESSEGSHLTLHRDQH